MNDLVARDPTLILNGAYQVRTSLPRASRFSYPNWNVIRLSPRTYYTNVLEILAVFINNCLLADGARV